jgi:hypothetical protein
MRVVPALLVLVAGCIAAEPGQGVMTESTQRKACTDLEGLSFQGHIENSQLVAFNPDDAEYSIYVETAADGAQSMGLAQCISTGQTTIIYLDGAIDRYSARVDVRPGAPQTYLRWTDGSTLVAY